MSGTTDRIPCPQCGASNFPTSATCWQCGRALRAEAQPPPGGTPIPPPAPGQPPLYPPARLPDSGSNVLVILGFIFAVLGLFCCPIFGIVAIIMGIIVLQRGNPIGTWIIVLAVVMLIVFGIAMAYYISFMAKHPEIFAPGNQPKFPFPVPAPK
ncbi:MAG TPA: DUF4190 domain-containing protein [Armatimonadota bacterium]|nr:DUF4190 domain-containing protein [Armatimonadota bacterium]